jgi:hypothetical protein
MAEEPKPHGWWQTVPGILTTIVGIITGLTGLIVALQQAGVFQKNPEPQVPSNSPTAESKNEPVILPLDLCQQLGGYAIYLDVNNYHGIIGPSGIALQQTGDGSFRFATNIVFSRETNREFSTEIKDPIAGMCQGKTISFTRKLWDASAQRYSGTISKAQAGAITIEGSFLDENDKKYLWSGRVDNPIP